MASIQTREFDVLVVGGGIAGLQAALDLADQDYRVAIVEKGPSIGGKMIRLSKVFPTLDCASCITTPKMAAAAHHENIALFTCCNVKSLGRVGSFLTADITQRPRSEIPPTAPLERQIGRMIRTSRRGTEPEVPIESVRHRRRLRWPALV